MVSVELITRNQARGSVDAGHCPKSSPILWKQMRYSNFPFFSQSVIYFGVKCPMFGLLLPTTQDSSETQITEGEERNYQTTKDRARPLWQMCTLN
uniref:Uncharacterized protein n=1 Tax=Anguilla anguilla TaxID=7936 RepID=A0A0E9X5J1_ANGAN